MLSQLCLYSIIYHLGAWIVQVEGVTALDTGFSLLDMLRRMHWPAWVVATTLALMSIYSISVIIERSLTFQASRNQSIRFALQASAALHERDMEKALAVTERHKRSHLAIVINAALQEYLLQQKEGEESSIQTEAIRDAVARAMEMKAAELSRGLSGLATIGSTAPFVGLLGTVVGIINAFQGLKVAEGSSLGAVAGGISEALIETAFGLVVAIPAVWTFNYFKNKLDAFTREMNHSSSELMRYLRQTQERRRS